jgi:hypothetical protein
MTDTRNLPAVTMAPKPMPPPSRPIANRQPGKIELPSWPLENKNDGETISSVQRRQPPLHPSSSSKHSSLNRASGPPLGPYDSSPNSGPRPGSYAGILDRKPASNVSGQPTKPSPLTRTVQAPSGRPLYPGQKPLLPPISSKETGSDKHIPVKPTEVKNSQGKPTPITQKTASGVPVRPLPNRPARTPPPPPNKPPVPPLPTKR